MKTIYPADLAHRERHQFLLSGVAPRPIALVSSMDSQGNHNLSPFSFFNAYSSKPPILAIGPAIAAKTGKAKDTWLNILETGECVVNTVSYSMVESMNLASCEYEKGVDEFEKSGLTKVPSVLVAPPRVQESAYQMECKLMQNIELRRDIGGNGNIMLLEVVCFHVADSVLVDGKVDPRRLDLVARMGYDYYCRADVNSIFEVQKPRWNGIGVDALPDHIRESTVLTGNDLAKLAGVQVLPMLDGSFPRFDREFRADSVEIELANNDPEAALYVLLALQRTHDRAQLQRIAKAFLALDKIEEAWQTLLLEG